MHSKEKGMKQPRQIEQVKAHSGWEFLSNEERWAVETILGNHIKTLRGRKEIERLMKKSFPFHSFDEIIKVRKEMIVIIAEEKHREK